MEKNTHKQMEEALAEIYRNAQLALTSISDILPEVGNDEELKKELHTEHEAYEHFSSRAAMLARDMGLELKEPNPMKKMMMWGSIKMSTMTNNSRSHIADMMLQGTVMGISALRTTAGDISPDGDERIRTLIEEMIAKEEEFERKWKSFL